MTFRFGLLLQVFHLCIIVGGLVLIIQPGWAQNCRTTHGWSKMDTQTIGFIVGEQAINLEARVADDGLERAAGYQWICPSMASETAVLFKFSKPTHSAFHMRNVFVPLGIYFFDASGQQVDAMVMHPEPPGQGIRSRYYQAKSAYQYALEIARAQDYDLNTRPTRMRLLIDTF